MSLIQTFQCPKRCGWAMHTQTFVSNGPGRQRYPTRRTPPLFCPKCGARL